MSVIPTIEGTGSWKSRAESAELKVTSLELEIASMRELLDVLGNELAGKEDNMRERLIGVYTVVNSSKIDDVDTILAKYRGREGELFEILRSKYGDAASIADVKSDMGHPELPLPDAFATCVSELRQCVSSALEKLGGSVAGVASPRSLSQAVDDFVKLNDDRFSDMRAEMTELSSVLGFPGLPLSTAVSSVEGKNYAQHTYIFTSQPFMSECKRMQVSASECK